MLIMNVMGITPAMPTMDGALPALPQTYEAQPVSMDAINFSMAVSTEVMDMATSAFEQAAAELISQMAAMTGVGQNLDVMA
jgi:hypothetical protein